MLFGAGVLGVVAAVASLSVSGLPPAGVTSDARMLPGAAIPSRYRWWRNPRILGVLGCLATLAVSVGIADRARSPWPVPAYCVFAAAVVTASLVDLIEFRIPRRLILLTSIVGGALLILASDGTRHWSGLADAGMSAGLVFLCYLVLHLFSPRSLGYGDVRMAGMCGLVVGWAGVENALAATAIAFISAGLFAGVLLATGVVTRTTRIPFGPFIAAGSLFVLLRG